MSFTLANTYQYASQYIRLAPLTFTTTPTGGRVGDPALSIGDWVRQTILSPPFTWRWNRSSSALSTIIGIQDYVCSVGAASATLANPGSVSITNNVLSITSAGFGATTTFGAAVNFSGFTTAALLFLNGTSGVVLSSTGTLLTCVYQHANLGATAAGGVGVIQANALSSIGWLECATIINAGISKGLEVKLDLPEDVLTNLPTSISTQADDGAGNITFRLLPAPDKIYVLNLTYQGAAPSFTTTAGTWAPIPDYMFHIYSQGFLAKAYEYLGDERWPMCLQMFLKSLIGFHGGLTESEISLFMESRLGHQSGAQSSGLKTQQGIMARGLQ